MIQSIDHFVLTVRSIDASSEFYCRVLGFVRKERPGRPVALHFGSHKIHLHQFGKLGNLIATNPTPGSQDFCLTTDRPIEDVVAHLKANGVEIEVGPVARDGALGDMISVYFRDPDGNLVEISRYGT